MPAAVAVRSHLAPLVLCFGTAPSAPALRRRGPVLFARASVPEGAAASRFSDRCSGATLGGGARRCSALQVSRWQASVWVAERLRRKVLWLARKGVPCSCSHLLRRGGTLMWNRHGHGDNTVVFIFAGTFTRSYLGFRRGGLGKLPAVGDTIVLTGKEPIRFRPGESASETGMPVGLRVTEIDEADDWFKGVWTYTHTYQAASNHGAPWAARIHGCCRFEGLGQQADTPFQLISAVDLSWQIGHTPVKGSGHIPAVALLHLFPGPPPPPPERGPPDEFTGEPAPYDWEPGLERHFAVSHPNFQSGLVDCQSPHGKACAESAALVGCDPSAAPPLVPGIDCAPYHPHCLRLLCPERYPLLPNGEPVYRAAGAEALEGEGAAVSGEEAGDVIDTEGRIVAPGWRGGSHYFLRMAAVSPLGFGF